MQPMFVLPFVRGPRDAGSGRSAFRNSIGTIFWPLKSMGSMRVRPTFSRHFRCVR